MNFSDIPHPNTDTRKKKPEAGSEGSLTMCIGFLLFPFFSSVGNVYG